MKPSTYYYSCHSKKNLKEVSNVWIVAFFAYFSSFLAMGLIANLSYKLEGDDVVQRPLLCGRRYLGLKIVSFFLTFLPVMAALRAFEPTRLYHTITAEIVGGYIGLGLAVLSVVLLHAGALYSAGRYFCRGRKETLIEDLESQRRIYKEWKEFNGGE